MKSCIQTKTLAVTGSLHAHTGSKRGRSVLFLFWRTHPAIMFVFYTAHCALSAPHNKRLWVIFITRAHYIVQFAETCPFKVLRESRVLITLLIKYIKISKWGHMELRKNSERPSRFCVIENCFDRIYIIYIHLYTYLYIMLRPECRLEIHVWCPIIVLRRDPGSIDLKFIMCNYMYNILNNRFIWP